MRHGNVNRKFGREKNQRAALLSSLAQSLIQKGRIKTTLAKAKEVRPLVEKMVTRSKKDTLQSRRMLTAQLGERTAQKLIKTASAYKERPGGYLRIVKMGPRMGDAAEMALIEFV